VITLLLQLALAAQIVMSCACLLVVDSEMRPKLATRLAVVTTLSIVVLCGTAGISIWKFFS
jgi:hypothetical protein